MVDILSISGDKSGQVLREVPMTDDYTTELRAAFDAAVELVKGTGDERLLIQRVQSTAEGES